jgi:hypothetical protein
VLILLLILLRMQWERGYFGIRVPKHNRVRVARGRVHTTGLGAGAQITDRVLVGWPEGRGQGGVRRPGFYEGSVPNSGRL